MIKIGMSHGLNAIGLITIIPTAPKNYYVALKKYTVWEYLLKRPLLGGFFENPLSNLCGFTMKASNTEAKLIYQHIQQKDPSTLRCTARQSVSKVLHLSIFSSYQTAPLRMSQSSEDGEILHEPWLCPASQTTALLAERSDNSEKNNWWFSSQEKKAKHQSRMFSEVLLVHSAFSLSAC